MSGTPTVLLAFANDQGAFLDSLQKETDEISDALRDRMDAGFIDVQVQQGATVERLFKLVSRYGDDVHVFHYGGHANGSALDLQSAEGGNVEAHSQGLAGLLGSLKNLQLVFLNGCATQGHVEALIAAGVPAVIATSAPVEDTIALEFASLFYTNLAERNQARTVEAAFNMAKNQVETTKGKAISFAATRGMTVGGGDPPAVGVDKWGLYAASGKEAQLAWSLPTKPAGVVMFQTAAQGMPGGAIATPNSKLIARLSGLIGQMNVNFSKTIALQIELNRGEPPEERIVRDEIANAFPSPIGARLNQLFSGGQLGEPRLQLLVGTYNITTRYIAFCLLAQLWDLFDSKPGAIKLSDAQWQAVEQFNACNEADAVSFDFLALAIALANAIKANGERPFMTECEGLEAAFAVADCTAAHNFMNQTRKALAEGSLDPAATAAATDEADVHLENALVAMTFVVGYTLAVIKQIKVSKSRNKEASFLHQRVILDRVVSKQAQVDPTRELTNFAANESVILLKDLDDVSRYLNLAPFMVDLNALTGNSGSKLYFLRWYDPEGDCLHYTHVNEARDQLEINAKIPVAGQPPNPAVLYHPQTLQLHKEFLAVVARR